jgi:hypothetical protein
MAVNRYRLFYEIKPQNWRALAGAARFVEQDFKENEAEDNAAYMHFVALGAEAVSREHAKRIIDTGHLAASIKIAHAIGSAIGEFARVAHALTDNDMKQQRHRGRNSKKSRQELRLLFGFGNDLTDEMNEAQLKFKELREKYSSIFPSPRALGRVTRQEAGYLTPRIQSAVNQTLAL